MGVNIGPSTRSGYFVGGSQIPRNGLKLWYDIANFDSYPSTGTTWYDISGNGNDGTINNSNAGSLNNHMDFDGTSEYVEITDAKTGQLNVAGHEVLHTITNAYLQDPTNLNRVVEGFKRRLNSKQKNYVENELKARGYKEEQFNREYLNIFSDGIVNGDISYNDGVFTQLKDFIKDNIFVPLGLLNPDAIGFKDGRQVYNFLKEYNQNIQQG